MSGPLAVYGPGQRDGFELAFSTVNDQIDGRPVQFHVADTQSTQPGAVNAYRVVVDQYSPALMFGVINSAASGAVAAIATDHPDIPWIAAVASGTLNRLKTPANVFRFAASTYQGSEAAMKWAKQNLHWNRVDFIGQNYAAGTQTLAVAKKVFGADGIAATELPPFNTTDWSSYLAKLPKADAVIGAVYGSGEVPLYQQYGTSGLKAQMPYMGISDAFDPSLYKQFGSSVVGLYSDYMYSAAIPGKQNADFVAAFEKKTGYVPGPFDYLAYMSGLAAIKALQASAGAGGQKAINTLDHLSITGPVGSVKVDKYHGIIMPFWIFQMKMVNGELQNVPVASLGDVEDPYSEFPG